MLALIQHLIRPLGCVNRGFVPTLVDQDLVDRKVSKSVIIFPNYTVQQPLQPQQNVANTERR